MPNHCNTHDIDYPWQGQCPECRAIEAAERSRSMLQQQEEARWEAHEREWAQQRDQEVRHEELIRLRKQEIYKRQNPGDYKCPECLYLTLKRGATRCPTCHAVIRQDYWLRIFEVESLLAVLKARQERLAAEEWAKGEPERQLRAKAAAEESERKRQEAEAAAADREVANLRREIVAERAALANDWKPVSFAGAVLVGLLVVTLICEHFANVRGTGFLHGLGVVVGSLGVIVFGLGFWISVVVVPVMAVSKLFSTRGRKARIAKLEADVVGRSAVQSS